jgi:hypothetical protein
MSAEQSAFRFDPELVTAFTENRLDDAGDAELAEQVARLLPFHAQLPHPIVARLLQLTGVLGGDEALLDWLNRHPGRPRVTARQYPLITLLDTYSANPGVIRALGELRAHDPYPHHLAGHLPPESTDHTLASLGQQIELLLADDRSDDAVRLSLRSLALLADIAPRAADLDDRAAALAAQVDALRRQIGAIAPSRDLDNGTAEAERGPS